MCNLKLLSFITHLIQIASSTQWVDVIASLPLCDSFNIKSVNIKYMETYLLIFFYNMYELSLKIIRQMFIYDIPLLCIYIHSEVVLNIFFYSLSL